MFVCEGLSVGRVSARLLRANYFILGTFTHLGKLVSLPMPIVARREAEYWFGFLRA